MDAGLISFWSKCRNIVDTYASAWSPVSDWKPLSIVPLLSPIAKELDQDVFNHTWDVEMCYNFQETYSTLCTLLNYGWNA